MFAGLNTFSQQNSFSIVNTPNKTPIMYQPRVLESAVETENSDIIWYENFREGLVGNNSSPDPAWSTQGDDSDVWEFDTDGSNGDYSNDFTIESETASNGWMIFDADKANAGLPVSSYSERKGQLTSPYIDLSNDSNVTLSFEHAYRWCCSNDHKILVSINDGTGWENETSFQVNELGDANVASGTVKVEIIITDLVALKDSVQIRFSWSDDAETASHYFWMIDDVKISKTQPYSSNILTSYNRCESDYFGGTSYKVMPLDQASSSAFFFGGIVENVGYNTLDSLRIFANIESEGYNSQSIGASIDSGNKDTLFANDGFTPTVIGDYSANILGKDDYDYVSTDTLTQSFNISQYIYARDNGDNTTNFSRFAINADGSREFGNVFDIYTNTTLYGITLRLDSRTTPNAKGTIRINTVDPNSGNITFLTESETINLGSNTEEWFDVTFNPPIILDAGQVILPTLYAMFNNVDTVYISTSGNNPNNNESQVKDIDGIQEGIAPDTWLYTTFTPCLRLNFNPDIIGVNVDIRENTKPNIFNVYPNPNKGIFNVQFFSEKNKEITLRICNILGQDVFSKQYTVTNSLNKTLNLSELDKGTYFISILNNNKQLYMKKITIQ